MKRITVWQIRLWCRTWVIVGSFRIRRRSAPKCYCFVVDNDINKNYIILVQFITKKDNVHYFGRIENTSETHYDILFLQWCANTWKSIFPRKDNRNVVSGKDSAWKLPPPIQEEDTMWVESFVVFPVDVTNVEVNQTFLELAAHTCNPLNN
jgi:hypothetical protein